MDHVVVAYHGNQREVKLVAFKLKGRSAGLEHLNNILYIYIYIHILKIYHWLKVVCNMVLLLHIMFFKTWLGYIFTRSFLHWIGHICIPYKLVLFNFKFTGEASRPGRWLCSSSRYIQENLRTMVYFGSQDINTE